ncbi:MAG: hypothetical protein H6722_02825 [Sandaracinus sp.]|nr:hypothetical protein [Sandaracinus sp.]
MTRPYFASVLAVLVALSVSAQAPVAEVTRDDTPARPRAAVLVSSANADTFFAAFTHELLATGLRERGYDVVPPHVAAAVLRVDGRDPEVCLAADACRDDVARTLGVGTVVIARLVIDASDARRARAELSLAHLGAPPASIGAAEGDALSFGEALRERSLALEVTAAPCAVRVRTSLEVQALVDGETLAPTCLPERTRWRCVRRDARRGVEPWSARTACRSK